MAVETTDENNIFHKQTLDRHLSGGFNPKEPSHIDRLTRLDEYMFPLSGDTLLEFVGKTNISRVWHVLDGAFRRTRDNEEQRDELLRKRVAFTSFSELYEGFKEDSPSDVVLCNAAHCIRLAVHDRLGLRDYIVDKCEA